MEFDKYKISNSEISSLNVKSARDTFSNGNVQENKNIFDRLPEHIAARFNDFVAAAAEEFKNRYTKDETDKAINEKVHAMGAGDMAQAVYDKDGNGIVDNAENGIFTYSQTMEGLEGNGVNGRFKCTAAGTYSVIRVNGEDFTVKCGEDSEIDLVPGVWYAFFLDGNTINFNRGGAGLNFKIVGGTQRPASPKENTIWVNTDIAVTGWVISKDQPEEVPLGTVWIKSDTTGNACINIAKKNRVYVTLNCCKQWTGSGFENRQASVYIDGQWQELLKVPLYIYNEGSSDTAITQYSTSNVYKNTETVYSEVTSWRFATGEVSNVTASMRTAEKLELTGYKTVKALVYARKGYGDADAGTPNISLFVTDEESQNLNTSNSAYNTVIASTIVNNTLDAWSEIELDITNISGMHYVGIGLGNKSSAASQLYVRALWLE
jgi:hypothetical protein